MIIVRNRLSFPDFKSAKYTEALQAEVEVQVRQAARAWLRAVIPLVPVFTGTARGSLQPIGRFLRVAVPIRPIAVREGMGPDVGAAQGKFKFEQRGKRFVFTFDPGVFHFIQNEFYHAEDPPFHLTHPTPWNATEVGNAAWEAYVEHILPQRLPRLKDYIKFVTKRTGP
jgi:hypothetical protein